MRYTIRITALLCALILSLLALTGCGGDDEKEKRPEPEQTTTTTKKSSGNPAIDDGWELVLVNADNPCPDTWVTPEYTELSDGYKIDRRAYPLLQQMFDDARAQGVYPYINSAYRSKEKQQQLWDEKYAQLIADGYGEAEAEDETNRWVNPPGTSEHQTALAFDVREAHREGADLQKVYDWLNANSWKYGYVKRYPEDKEAITGIGNEPWHFRYVGLDAAKEMYEKNLCLEEYVALLNE